MRYNVAIPPAVTAPSRRERLRAQTLAEIREHAYAQIAQGGPAALSLNGIAKAMGMSGPALYRYFSSRDE
ncbi:MAG: helix-turn-helix transcriptional regulator, partial [Solirubrobacterales bacterium]|nr:helix-turn-helix transcriptional regulator [Solirubrobacterales bacterium]